MCQPFLPSLHISFHSYPYMLLLSFSTPHDLFTDIFCLQVQDCPGYFGDIEFAILLTFPFLFNSYLLKKKRSNSNSPRTKCNMVKIMAFQPKALVVVSSYFTVKPKDLWTMYQKIHIFLDSVILGNIKIFLDFNFVIIETQRRRTQLMWSFLELTPNEQTIMSSSWTFLLVRSNMAPQMVKNHRIWFIWMRCH